MLTVLSIAFVFVCVLLILLILIQRPKGGGLAGAFGGAGGSDQAMFGAKAGDALTWITVSLFVCFLLLAMGLTWTTQSAMKANDVPIYNLPVDAEGNPAQATDADAQTTDQATDTAKSDTEKPVDAVKKDAADQTPQDAADKTEQATPDVVKTAKPQAKETTPAPNDSEAK